MTTLHALPLSVLLHELRTAERLAGAVAELPREEADVHRTALATVREARLAELDRRAALIDEIRDLPPRTG
jgi:hypothetical protein